MGDDSDTESQPHRHPLGELIDHAITSADEGVVGTAGYFVRHDDGALTIYREVEQAETREELDREGDYVTELFGVVRAADECGHIAPPEDGWDAEIDAIAELREERETDDY